ncbi:MAG: hypothetical protein KAI29_07430 [Cyclobacteriaceae bacterium]|nr:hypothetical protein [Cyclobacteriaceae bacterium]
MIQRVIIFMFAAFAAYACATSKKVVDISIGEWEYVIKDTPNGDIDGILTIAKDGDYYTGALHSAEGDLPLNNVAVENDKLVSTFDYSGYTVDMTGVFAGDTFTGKCSVEYNEFPMTAVRKK